MAVFQCFILPEELDFWLIKLSTDKGLAGYLKCFEPNEFFRRQDGPWVFVGDCIVDRLFLFPANQTLPPLLTWNSIRPREWGWLDVTVGRLIRSGDSPGLTIRMEVLEALRTARKKAFAEHPTVLTLTTLQTEDKKELAFKPSLWIRWLKGAMKSALMYGVEGVNLVHGGKSVYMDIGYSLGALRRFETGFLWKQFVNDNVAYSPLINRKPAK